MGSTSSAFHDIETFADAKLRESSTELYLPERMIGEMEKDGVERQEIDRIVGRFEARRKSDDDGLLNSDASERAVRLARIIDLAQRVFGSKSKAFLWLRSPHPQMGGDTPISYVRSEGRARLVEETLLRIDHGIAA